MKKETLKASIITTLSIITGIAYFWYLNSVSFPHDLSRIVPFIWLAEAIMGFRLGTQLIREQSNQLAGIVTVIVCMVSAVFAAIFSMAALMGD